MLILLLLYFASQSWAKGLWDSVKHYFVDEYPRDSNYTLKYVPSCPDAGYFFHREPAANALMGPCHLCFCQGRNTAVCWERENKKCDLQHYKHNNSIAKKENRVKRSPLGFGDIFFKDAARDVFNKAEPEMCKPYESSFSEGCPPVDWCTGCTVCDCDADGHWDCHILSFCDDEKDKGKKKMSYPKPRKTGSSKLSKQKKAPPSRTTKRPFLRAKATTKKPPAKKSAVNNPQRAGGISKAKKSRSVIQKGKPAKPLIIKKNAKKPKAVKTSASRKVMNGSETAMNEQIMKTMMATMQKLWTKQVTSSLPDIVKMIQKRSFGNQGKKGSSPVKYKKMSPAKKSGKTHTFNKSLFMRKQKREQQKKEIQRKRDIQKKDALAAKQNAAKKPVPKTVNKNNKPISRANNKPAKKPTNKKPPTNKPNTKPNNKNNKLKNTNNKRSKREIAFQNQTDSLTTNNYSDISFIPTANVQVATEQEVIIGIPSIRSQTYNTQTTTSETDNIPTSTSKIYIIPTTTSETENIQTTASETDNIQVTNSDNGTKTTTSETDNVQKTSDTDNIKTTNSMYTNTNYYKYAVHVTTDDPRIGKDTNIKNPKVEVVIQKDNNNNKTKFNHKIKYLKDKINLVDEIPNEVANDIKFSKWSEIKLFQVKENATNVINKTKMRSYEENRKPLVWRDIERKIDRTTKKYSLLRMVNTKNNYKSKRGHEINVTPNFGPSLSSKIENLRNVLKRLLGEFRGSNSTTVESKKKKANAIKYLKKFFNKIFFKDSNKTNINQRMRNNNHTIQMLCESFGPCIVNRKNKEILVKKIRLLNNETVQIIKSLRIIKGLLRLIDFPYDSTTTTPLNKTSNFKKDIRKLNVILRKSFEDKDWESLSETQRIQINYIKKNTQIFTQSVARFTKILNNIIDLISVKSNNEKGKWYRSTQSKKNITKTESVKKFKQLLHNYNIVHNAFIAKIIDMFSNLQSHNHDGNTTPKNNKTGMTGTEYYSHKVMRNLNKLKNLALALNPLRRQKRHAVRQDNAVEYLLMLMEYMFQQNQLDSAPVNDGIDLLIEAIKNAPDIKSVKKKVLKNGNFRSKDGKIAELLNSKNNVSREVSLSENYISDQDSINKISNEDSKSILHVNDNSSALEQGESGDDENESDLQILKFKNKKTVNEPRTKLKINDNQDIMNLTRGDSRENQRTNDYETSTESPKVYMAEDDALNDFDSRLEKVSGDLSKKNEAYNSDLEEEGLLQESLGVTKAANIVTEELTETPMVTKNYKAPPKSYSSYSDTGKSKPGKEEIRSKLTEKKAKETNNVQLKSSDWIEDMKNPEDIDAAPISNNTIDESSVKITKVKNKNDGTSNQAATKDSKKNTEQIFEIDISDGSKEDSDEKSKAKKKAEDVMIKKEQDLLNSLDYGTETSIVEDSESKDGAEEKFLSDYFAE